MTPLEIRDNAYFEGRLEELAARENGNHPLNEIRNSAFKIFSSLPILESGQVKFIDDLKSLPSASFNENYRPFIEGYSPANKLCGVGSIKDFTRGLDKELMTPLTGFGAYCLAFFQNGLYVDCGSSEEKAFLQIEAGKGLSLEPVFINVPQEKSATLLLSFAQESESVSFDLIRADIGENASLRLFLLFKGALGKRFVDFSAGVAKNGKAEVFTIRQDGADFVYRSIHALRGEGSVFAEKAIASLKMKENADIKSVVIEDAPGINANIELRAIAKDSSRIGLNGMIKVSKKAVKSKSRFSGHCLKLSKGSRADVQPNLEIEALDVEASHAASVSPIDNEKLFYLEARGMSTEDAKKEISLGFLAALLKDHGELTPIVEALL
jgi:hypothetical protein